MEPIEQYLRDLNLKSEEDVIKFYYEQIIKKEEQIIPVEEILFELQQFLEKKQLYESGTLDARS